jgi:hypothetical protein
MRTLRGIDLFVALAAVFLTLAMRPGYPQVVTLDQGQSIDETRRGLIP